MALLATFYEPWDDLTAWTASGTLTFVASANTLIADLDSGSGDHNGTLTSDDTFDFTGSELVGRLISGGSTDSIGYVRIQFSSDADHWLQCSWSGYEDRLRLSYDDGGGATEFYNEILSTPDATLWFRFTESAGDFEAFTSTDGSSWNSEGTVTAFGTFTDVEVVIFQQSLDTPADADTVWGVLNPDAEPVPPVVVIAAPYLSLTPEFRLAIFPPLGSGRTERLDTISVDPQVTSLSWRSSWPYGFDELRVGLDVTHETPYGPVTYSRLPVRVHTQPFNHVQLWCNSALVFEGRMGPDAAEGDAFTAFGYWSALADNVFLSTDTTADTTGGVLQDVLSNAAPIIGPATGDDWQDPQVSHTASDFDGLTPKQILDQVVREGTTDGFYVDWGIFEGRRLLLVSRSAPATPDYILSYDPGRMRWQRDPSELRSAVAVEFTAFDGGTATITAAATSVTVTHTLGFTPDAEHIKVTPTNSLGTGAKFYIDNIGSTSFRINLVAPQEASGTATITAAATSIAVTHGLSRTPSVSEIMLRLTNLPTAAIGEWYVDTIGGTQFTIRCRNVPGAATAIFGWRARLSDTPVATVPGTPTATFSWSIVVPGSRTSWAESSTFIDRWGVTRRPLIKAGTLTIAAAERIRDTILEESQDVKHRISVSWPFAEPLPGPQAQPQPPWLLRAGRWGRVADSPDLVTVRVQVDANAERVQFEAGSRELTYRTLIEALERDVQAYRNGVNAVVGGRN